MTVENFLFQQNGVVHKLNLSMLPFSVIEVTNDAFMLKTLIERHVWNFTACRPFQPFVAYLMEQPE